jgi:hypothetical protein
MFEDRGKSGKTLGTREIQGKPENRKEKSQGKPEDKGEL